MIESWLPSKVINIHSKRLALQGDTSRWFKPHVDIKTKAPLWPGLAWPDLARPKRHFWFDVNGRFESTWCITLYFNLHFLKIAFRCQHCHRKTDWHQHDSGWGRGYGGEEGHQQDFARERADGDDGGTKHGAGDQFNWIKKSWANSRILATTIAHFLGMLVK